MEIAKLHKPQRMGNWKNVLTYSSEEDEENPDALADAEAAANADSTSTPTDSTSSGVQITERGISTTSQDSTGRITFSINPPVWINTADDSTEVDSLMINLSGGIGPISGSIELAIPLPEGEPPTPPPQDSGYCPQCLHH